MDYYVYVNSIHVQRGRDEFGHPIIAEIYAVEITDQNGRKWVHDHRFNDFGAADRLARKVHANGGPMDWVHWRETDPVYGSKAYFNDWEHQEYMLDMMDRESEWC